MRMYNNVKKVLTVALMLAVLLSCNMAFAAEPAGVNVSLDGKALNFDTPPQVIDGRTMVPLRGILEALGLELKWDPQTKLITAQNKDYTIILPVDSKTAIVNGKAVTLDVPATITNGRTMVPARFISESAGADVKWDDKSKTVNITSADYSKTTNNSNNLSNISNSNVNLTNNNVDNSVNNSNNTINNYDYSTNITNNITNNYTVNGMDENLLKQILAKLIGTQFVNSAPQTGTNNSNTVDLNNTTVNLSDSPVILPLDKQPDAAWKDGIITYQELVRTNLRIAFTLPKGLGLGKTDANGLNSGYVKYVEFFDENGDHLSKYPSPVEKLELEKGIAVIRLSPWAFNSVKDGETVNIRTYIEKDGQFFSDFSNTISFVFKDDPNALKIRELHIKSIFSPSPDEIKLFEPFEYPVTFVFKLQTPLASSGNNQAAVEFATNRCIYSSTVDFVLKADGYSDVTAFRSKFSMGSQKGTLFAVSVNEPEKLVKGVKYQLVPVDQNPDAKWIVNDGVYYTAP